MPGIASEPSKILCATCMMPDMFRPSGSDRFTQPSLGCVWGPIGFMTTAKIADWGLRPGPSDRWKSAIGHFRSDTGACEVIAAQDLVTPSCLGQLMSPNRLNLNVLVTFMAPGLVNS